MELDIETLVSFSDTFQDVTTGLYIQKKNLLITGHSKGFLMKWNIENGSGERIFYEDTDVRTLAIKDNLLAVGYRSGGLYLINLDNNQIFTIIEPENSKYKRIWKVLWINDKKLLVTSTYGNMSVIKFNGEAVKSDHSKEHYNSIFSAGGILGGLYATGDWAGKINIWSSEDEGNTVLNTLNITNTVQDIGWKDIRYISIIDSLGKVYLFEMDPEIQFYWNNVVELEVAKGRGKCIVLTDDFESIIAGTTDNLIQFDIETQQYDEIEIKNASYISSINQKIYVLNNEGFYSFDKKNIEIKKELVNYKYIKISLLGYTGTGKSTFCNWFIYDKFVDQGGTLGKQIWACDLPEIDGVPRRLLLNDYGGQENVLESFLPYVLDSDIIFLFYMKKDKKTLDKAIDILNFIQTDLNKKCKIYLIETHIDDPVPDVTQEDIDLVMRENPLILANIQISPKINIGKNEIIRDVLDKIDWRNARSILQSELLDIINNILSGLKESKRKSISVDEFRKLCEAKFGQAISSKYFRFILEDYKNKGIIDYFNKDRNKIILNDPEYNALSTNIPIYIRSRNGIINKEMLITRFGDIEYVHLLLDLYLSNNICYNFDGKLIFPFRLNDNFINLPKKYEDKVNDKYSVTYIISNPTIKIRDLMEILSDQKLQCINVSKRSGIFEWSNYAFIYYDLSENRRSGNITELKCNCYYGGEKEDIINKLKNRFIDILKIVYGEKNVILDENSEKEIKKKITGNKKYKYNVAFSFAGEQRGYVEEVFNKISGYGLETFYDADRIDLLWGEHLPEYLSDLFENKAEYCIMFVSKEYMEKYYPTIERTSAIKRQLKLKRKYILPVIFDKVNFPEIEEIGHIDARIKTPTYVATTFIKKWEGQDIDHNLSYIKSDDQ